MKLDEIFNKININRVLLIVIGVLLVLILLNSVKTYFDHDEFETIHTSWKILQGEKIYVDFFQHHHPLFYYVLIPIICLLGENIKTIIAIRLIVFIITLLILFVAYLIAKNNFNKETGIVSILLLAGVYTSVAKVVEIRPNVPETLFALISILFLLVYLEKKNLKYLLLSSFSLGISFLFLQLALFLVIFLGCLLLFEVYKKNIYFFDVLIYFFIFFLTLAPYGIYLLYTKAFFSYFQFNWILNIKFLDRFSPFDYLLHTFRTNTILCVFYIVGLLFFTRTPNQQRIGFLSLGLLLSVFFVRHPLPQYYMLAMPLIAITSAHAIYAIFKYNKAILVVVLVFSVVPHVGWLVQKARNTNGDQLEKIEYVLSITDPDDFVYDGNIKFNIFRKDVDFFWFSVMPRKSALATFQTMTDYHYDIYEIIDKMKPKVISAGYYLNMEDHRIKDYYVQSKRYKAFFIRK